MMHNLEKLRIWKEAQDLTQEVHELLKPMSGNFSLKDQIDRSSQAVADNIAEMYGAYYYNNKIKALYDARKEALETINHIIKFERRGLWPSATCQRLKTRYDNEIKGINAYIRYVAQYRDQHNKKPNKTS